ncbi:MAG: hypothetical protein KAT48_13170 [Bacteroidales bacterium]|nr:hypothetical protein [Bacteroidales bacterium]
MKTNSSRKLPDDFQNLSHQILLSANSGGLRIDFIQEVVKMLLDFSGCNAIELWIKKEDNLNHIEIASISNDSFRFETKPFSHHENGKIFHKNNFDSELEILCGEIFLGHYDPTLPFFTEYGSFWTNNADKPFHFSIESGVKLYTDELIISNSFKSLALIPLLVSKENIGLLQLKSIQYDFFSKEEIKLYEGIAPTLGVALMNQFAQAALDERVKELTCLCGIAKIAEQFDSSLDEILQSIVNLLPPAWQYPEITCGRIVFDGRSFSTQNFQESQDKQTANIIVDGKRRGFTEVAYLEEMLKLDEGPFLKEERSLIDTIAEQVALIVERKQAAEEREKLQTQLRHADRLATIGQLAAGVAHEINEPLGNILGFAQLAVKNTELPKQPEQDLNKIIAVTLQAREIIKKLMIFARQKQPEKTIVNINTVVNDGLPFLESRSSKEGIELVRLLSPDIPAIVADPSQLDQVLTNLVINSLHAMPQGGKLTIRTEVSESHVSLIVKDTGIGMSDDVKKQMFIPFFTTKDVGQGTGIGLSVVHGIITSHGGSIKVESELGKGTRFEIQLPINDTQKMKKKR